MRITKEPEERRQELLDTAIQIFCEKGYEKTSISDIAKAAGVAQGLCYRYFPSKEALFDCAIGQYAKTLAGRLLPAPDKGGRTLREMIETMPVMAESEEDACYRIFHTEENKKFHDQLTLRLCENLSGTAASLLKEARDRGEIELDDIQAAASFCVYGQIGILSDKNSTAAEKERRIRSFLIYALRL